jgi:serine/threonine protein kinase
LDKLARVSFVPRPWGMAKPPTYRIVEKIGEGGMGVVYRAEDQILHRDVAIKVLRIDPERHLSPEKIREIQRRFQREAQAAARLNHPNIVSVYQVGTSGNQPYMVMEYLKGRSLVEVMEEETPVNEVLKAMIQVCAALHYAHSQGVIHRDVKPDNIVLGEDGRVKITDFGIARLDEPDGLQTRTGVLLGSPAYCAPEQLKDFRHVDGRADIFSVGVVLYQWLTRQLPFDGEAATEVISRILANEPAPPRVLNPEIPPELEAVILKALAKEPGQRYQTAGELQAALEKVLRLVERKEERPVERTQTMVPSRSSPLQLPLTVTALLFFGLLLYGVISLKGERGILEKNASLKGTNMARMLEVVGLTDSSPQGLKILQGYLQAMGRERDTVFLEISRGERTLAKFTDPARMLQEREIYVRGFPLRMEGGEEAVLIVGFSKAVYNARVRQTWTVLIAGGALVAAFGGFHVLRARRVRGGKWKR